MLAKQKALSSRPAKGHFISKIGHSRLIKKGFSNARDVGGGNLGQVGVRRGKNTDGCMMEYLEFVLILPTQSWYVYFWKS